MQNGKRLTKTVVKEEYEDIPRKSKRAPPAPVEQIERQTRSGRPVKKMVEESSDEYDDFSVENIPNGSKRRRQ